jgi:hypothetical protein
VHEHRADDEVDLGSSCSTARVLAYTVEARELRMWSRSRSRSMERSKT